MAKKSDVDLNSWSSEELLDWQKDINEELKNRQGRMTIELSYNNSRKISKAWVAKVDDNKSILSFIDPLSVQCQSEKKGVKTFELEEGIRYIINELDLKSNKGKRYYATVSNGKLVKR